MTAERMTKGERDDLIRLVKQRERVAKSTASQNRPALRLVTTDDDGGPP